MMKRRMVCVLASALALGATGCASLQSTGAGPGAALDPEGLMVLDEDAVFRPALAEALLEELPVAPWASAPLSDRAAMGGVVEAWRGAENRTFCAPLSLEAADVDGAVSRVVELEGGWSVEFDRAGLPGIDEDGESCATCGHGVFGVAGTGMQIDELEPGAAGAPTYRDGSAAEIVTEGGVAAATLAIHGQGCVYQVWSFLGEEHLRELLGSLRFVAVLESGSGTQVAGVSY